MITSYSVQLVQLSILICITDLESFCVCAYNRVSEIQDKFLQL